MGPKSAGSPPTRTVISPAAARCTPPVTGRLQRRDALSSARRRGGRSHRGRWCSSRSRSRPAPGRRARPWSRTPLRRPGRRQAGDDGIDCRGRLAGLSAQLAASGQKRSAAARSRSWTVTSKPPRMQARGQMPAEMAEADEAVAHAGSRVSRSAGSSGSRCSSAVLIGMGQRDLLVELDAEAGLRRRDDVARPPSGSASSESAHGSRPSARCSRGSGNSGCRSASWMLAAPTIGPAIEMRRDLGVVGLGHAGDLLGLQEPADAAQIHLQDRGGAAVSSTRANSYLVVSRSPVAIGIARLRARPGPSPPASPAAPAPRTTGDRRARSAARGGWRRRR